MIFFQNEGRDSCDIEPRDIIFVVHRLFIYLPGCALVIVRTPVHMSWLIMNVTCWYYMKWLCFFQSLVHLGSTILHQWKRERGQWLVWTEQERQSRQWIRMHVCGLVESPSEIFTELQLCMKYLFNIAMCNTPRTLFKLSWTSSPAKAAS